MHTHMIRPIARPLLGQTTPMLPSVANVVHIAEVGGRECSRRCAE